MTYTRDEAPDQTNDWAASTLSDVLLEEQVGRTRWRTPEGYLYCEGVRIARTGPMLYRPDEVLDVTPAPGDKMVVITRDESVLFDPMTVFSFAGKPVTLGHPPVFVKPDNYKKYSVGTMLCPRRGEGVDADYLLVDLLIQDKGAIDAVEAGTVEVSPGYAAPKKQIRPGVGIQTAMMGNHVALVKRGRGGPACAIEDEEPDMSKPNKLWDRVRAAFKAQDENALNELIETDIGNTTDEKPADAAKEPAKITDTATFDSAALVNSIDSAVKAINAVATEMRAGFKQVNDALDGLRDEDTDDEGKDCDDPNKKDATADSAGLLPVFTDVCARAELLSPGISMETLDAAVPEATARSRIRDVRVRSLNAALQNDVRGPLVRAVMGDVKDAATLSDEALEVAHRASSEMIRTVNNGRMSHSQKTFPQGPMTAAKLQELNVSRRAKA